MVWVWEPTAEDNTEDLFARVRSGEARPEDHELFDACMLERFIRQTHAGKDVEPWIMRVLADAFLKILHGSEWNDEIRLPGRPETPVRSWREERDFEIACEVANALLRGDTKVTDAIQAAADNAAVSFETARSAYYRWKPTLDT